MDCKSSSSSSHPSSSSSCEQIWKYDVFLSFCSNNSDSISRFYLSLLGNGVKTLVHEKKGDHCPHNLLKAIKECRISIVFFTRDYAKSTWCLDELAMIAHCIDSVQQIVVPMFYFVDHFDVTHQTGVYHQAFAQHQERFKNNLERVKKWRNAMTKVANRIETPFFVILPNALRNIIIRAKNSGDESELKTLFGGDKINVVKINTIEQLNKKARRDSRNYGLSHREISVFEDIACFFVGEEIDNVNEILGDCYIHSKRVVSTLLEKSLISISGQKIQMRHTLQRLVQNNFSSNPRLSSRVWFDLDTYLFMKYPFTEVLTSCEALVLKPEDVPSTPLWAGALSQMPHLRLLIIQNVNFSGMLHTLSNYLRHLSWHRFPFTHLPLNFKPNILVQLIMRDSNIKELWKGLKTTLPSLKVIDLRSSANLKETPDFERLPNLEKLDFEGCIGLVQLDPSIACLHRLTFLNLRNCTSLESLPSNLFGVRSLEVLNVAGCSKFAECLDFDCCDNSIEEELHSNLDLPLLEEIRKPLVAGGITPLEYHIHDSPQPLRGSYGQNWKYDVFLSFCDEDKLNYTIQFYLSLSESDSILSFSDYHEKREHCPPNLLQEIEQCRISIVLFSRNYAASLWCLDELAMIAHCIDSVQQFVVPIFCDVGPCDVRCQTGVYYQTFVHHETKFKNNLDTVKKWRNAMSKVARRSMTIEEIQIFQKLLVKAVYNKDDEGSGFVDEQSEILFHVAELEFLVDLGSDDVRAIGICGSMTTTIAFAFYERVCHKFDACCFFEINLDNFMPYGIASLQNNLLQQILKQNQNIWNVDQGTMLMSTSLRSLKTLLVIDKVDHPLILWKLVQIPWFGAGSRIIIATTNEYELEIGLHDIYRAEKMNHEVACKDSRNHKLWDLNDDCLVELPKDIEACQDSRNDYGMTKQEMDVFLDIACFFVGHELSNVTEILGDCYNHSKSLISTLVDKSVISIFDQKIQMAHMLQILGQRLVRQESPLDIENRSRLWYDKETISAMARSNTVKFSIDDKRHMLQILGQRHVRQESLLDIENRSNTEKFRIEDERYLPHFIIDDEAKKYYFRARCQALVLNPENPEEMPLPAEAISTMCYLRLLIIRNVNFFGYLGCLSNELRHLSWHRFPFYSLPSLFMPRKLVQLIMRDSQISQLWEELETELPFLKTIDLRGSKQLKETPDFHWFPNLERLDFEGCIKLVQLHPSIARLQSLRFLNLRNCTSLRSLPNNLFGQTSLEFLNLAGCSKFAQCLDFHSRESFNYQRLKFLEWEMDTKQVLRHMWKKLHNHTS